MDAKLHFKI